jgi:ATP synthase protein I
MAEPSPSAGSSPVVAAFSAPPSADPDPSPAEDSDHGMGEYRRLQQRLLLATAVATALVVPVAAWLGGGLCALSLLLGGLAGLLYLRLLARSVSRIGGDRKSVGKVQLLVPVVLVLATTRIPQLQILPALLGFLLYKPALIVQMVLEG